MENFESQQLRTKTKTHPQFHFQPCILYILQHAMERSEWDHLKEPFLISILNFLLPFVFRTFK